MGQRRLAGPQADDTSKRPNNQQPRKKSNNTVLNATTTRKGEVFRAQRRTSENVNLRASQHVINVPVNKSIYNGLGGKQFSLAEEKKRPRTNGPVLKIMPIGGLGEMGIGKNMMAIEYEDEIVIIDAGFLFPGPDYPGINYITPDITYLEANKHKIKAHIFTHGHLDHIGAYRHLAHRIPAPVYGGKFTLGMVGRTMEEATSGYEPEYHVLDPESHERAQVGDNFSIELVRVNHSIPDATAVVVRTPLGVLVNTGDWRFDENPVDGHKFDMERLTEISAKEGIMLLMSDSTSCEVDGENTHGEHDVQATLGEIMDKYTENRLIISSFSSQLHRMQVILEEAHKHGRKVAVAGYSMIQNLEVALRTGTVKVPKDTVVKMEDAVKLPDGKVVVVCTGSQGEFNAVLNRMATGAHKYMKVKPNDIIVLSSSVVPGNIKYVVRTIDGLMREGSEVMRDRHQHLTGVSGPLHSGGHGHYLDHIKFISALNPTYYMPIHGEFHMLVHNARIAEKECGMRPENIFVCDSGDVLELTVDGLRRGGRIPVGGDMYDDSGAVVSEVVLKDRIHMSQEGIFVVVLTVQRGSGRLLTSPDIISRGFIYMRDSEELMGMIRQYLKQKVARTFTGKKFDMDVVKKELRDEITHILYDQTHRTPIVIPVINEIGGGGKPQNGQNGKAGQAQRREQPVEKAGLMPEPSRRKFPPRQAPDTETVEPRVRSDTRGY